MAYKAAVPFSRLATWGRRISLLALQLLILTWLLHRFYSLYTPAAVNLFFGILIAAGVSFILSFLGLFRVWNRGTPGAGAALSGFLISLFILALPATQISKFAEFPNINDITTDTDAPPPFDKLALARDLGANTVLYPGADYAQIQQQDYPDIQPMTVKFSAQGTFDVVQKAVRDLGWSIVKRVPPDKRGNAGYIEAVDNTFILGFKDDISIRVSGNRSRSRIDIRSASRFGSHDLGRNTLRIRLFLNTVNEILEKGETRPRTRKKTSSRL